MNILIGILIIILTLNMIILSALYSEIIEVERIREDAEDMANDKKH